MNGGEWNGKATFKIPGQKAAAHDALFKTAKFTTVFGHDPSDMYGDTAVVRTSHDEGAAIFENGRDIPAFNREPFVLRKSSSVLKIVLFASNTNPVQEEG